MLPSQRDQFDMPREVCFLNAASWSPLPKAVQQAGQAGVLRKGRPWTLDRGLAGEQHERARRAAAALINADPEDVALISSVGYGVATAGKILDVPRGSRVLVLEEDHSSPVLEWMTRAADGGFTVETVRAPADGDWTRAVLAAIERPGAPPLALGSMSSVHWSDAGAIDLDQVVPALRRQGAAVLIDATHGAGVMPIDVQRLDVDFLVFPTYKWVLGPYGRAFLYINKRRQEAIPLEQTAYGRRSVLAEQVPYMKDTAYKAGARRFDMGERDHFITLEMAALGMEMMAGWGQKQVCERLAMLTGRLGTRLAESGIAVPDAQVRAPHIISLPVPPDAAPALAEQLAAQDVHVAPRLGRLRISPHVYNDEADIDRFVSVFRQLNSRAAK